MGKIRSLKTQNNWWRRNRSQIALLNLPVEPPRRADPINHPFFLTTLTEFSAEAIPNFGVNVLKKEAA